MKQYTTPEQTAKLIELGFEKPRMAAPRLTWVDGEPTFVPQYTIGELCALLPKNIDAEIWFGEDKGKIGVWSLSMNTAGDDYPWDVTYERPHSVPLYSTCERELIDALYDMCVELKEEEVI